MAKDLIYSTLSPAERSRFRKLSRTLNEELSAEDRKFIEWAKKEKLLSSKEADVKSIKELEDKVGGKDMLNIMKNQYEKEKDAIHKAGVREYELNQAKEKAKAAELDAERRKPVPVDSDHDYSKLKPQGPKRYSYSPKDFGSREKHDYNTPVLAQRKDQVSTDMPDFAGEDAKEKGLKYIRGVYKKIEALEKEMAELEAKQSQYNRVTKTFTKIQNRGNTPEERRIKEIRNEIYQAKADLYGSAYDQDLSGTHKEKTFSPPHPLDPSKASKPDVITTKSEPRVIGSPKPLERRPTEVRQTNPKRGVPKRPLPGHENPADPNLPAHKQKWPVPKKIPRNPKDPPYTQGTKEPQSPISKAKDFVIDNDKAIAAGIGVTAAAIIGGSVLKKWYDARMMRIGAEQARKEYQSALKKIKKMSPAELNKRRKTLKAKPFDLNITVVPTKNGYEVKNKA